jgi:hypothetical protein
MKTHGIATYTYGINNSHFHVSTLFQLPIKNSDYSKLPHITTRPTGPSITIVGLHLTMPRKEHRRWRAYQWARQHKVINTNALYVDSED